MLNARHYSLVDQIIISANTALQTLFGSNRGLAIRSNPAKDLPEKTLSNAERKQVASLMRINHVGEVCAQALYQGQALTAHSIALKNKFQKAAQEENDHLAWCAERLHELNSHVSYLNPLWYIGSLAIGVTAGLAGDRVNLGFLAETEHQVEQHLTEHLQKLPLQDQKSRTILEQMRIDEAQHATMAEQAGAIELPTPIKFTMRCLSNVMKFTAYWI